MEVKQPKSKPSSMNFDEVSMERSKSFVKALQELKNLRPQLYSAAEYCEKSYLRSDEKQMILDNLKDYSVRALVNAVDHIGTVAYKLTDLVEHQTSEVSTMDVKVNCLDQKLLTCQTYMDREGLRQQQLLAIIPRHHKHYLLPNSANKNIHFSHLAQAIPKQTHVQARSRDHSEDSPGSKCRTSHPTPETKTVFRSEFQKASPRSVTVFHLVDTQDSVRGISSGNLTQLPSGNPEQSYGVMHRDTAINSRPMTPLRSSDNTRQAIVKAPNRHKSMLSALFVKQRTLKIKTGTVS